MIAFFAPCCSGVMLPTYPAAISGNNRMRTARLSAIYVAGVATIVWPITLGAGAIGHFTNHFHPQLFVLGGLMMLMTAAVLWRGGYRKRTSLSRLVGTVVFGACGLLFIGLAFAGESRHEPGFQRWISAFLNGHLAAHAGQIPNWITWPALMLFATTLIVLVVKPSHKKETTHEQEIETTESRSRSPGVEDAELEVKTGQ